MALFATGVSHRTAPVELREQLAVPAERLPELLAAMRAELALGEVAVLSTCNRTEIYCTVAGRTQHDAAADDELAARLFAWLAARQKVPAERLQQARYRHDGEAAVRHMMRVASGLDSLVLGEPQVLGQMKDAYAVAHQAGTVGKELERCFQQVFAVAKRVRTDTAIGANPVSMAFAAVSLARHLFSNIRDTRALLIGAGEMIELVARHLDEQGVRGITVANRTLERAHALADRHGGRAVTMEEIPYALESADMVISCTAATVPVLGKGAVERALKKRRHRPLFLVDLAVPRDIEPEVAQLDDVYLYTVDDLQGVIEQNVKAREDAARDAEQLVEQGSRQYLAQQRESGAADTLRRVRSRVEALRDAELDKALADIARGADPAETLQRMGRNLTNKLLHDPSLAMKQAAADGREDLLAFARSLFAIDDDGHDRSPGGDA
ncbi:MAG: glutamyl-tRNA reductase [Pseudomonadota bacterium]